VKDLENAAQTAAVSTGRENNFNVIRLLAATLVIFGHMHALLAMQPFVVMGQNVSSIAVKVFFVISGYLICISWQRDSNPLRFAIRRIFRIIPALIFVVLASVFVVGPIFSTLSVHEYFRSRATYSYLKNIFLYISYALPGVFGNNIYPVAVNGSLWTLPVEMFMYVQLPIFCWLGVKLKSPKAVLVSAAVILMTANVLSILFNNDYRIVIYATSLRDGLSLAPYFFLGTLFTFPEVKKLLNIQIAFAMVVVGVSLTWPGVLSEIVGYIVIPYAVLSFALVPKPLFSKIGSKNDYSYGIYLWGFLVQQMVVCKFGTSLGGVVIYSVICTILTAACAFISWHLVEKHAMNLSRAITKKLKAVSKVKA
jgi:peptidoglycan/LPS O-acetylase OafA/YrhL